MCGGVSALALTALISPADAQTKAPAAAAPAASTPDATPEVIVTAIRKSLKHAQDIKKNSDVIVDSITSEDIGALPDRSVTEALARIPGISINRFAASNDPDHFSQEGSGVTVRGLTYTRSELNGRDSFGADSGRALSFSDVPAELMAGVDVYKSASADMIEGGIGGTVDLRTRVPFDQKGQTFAFSLEDSYGDFAKKTTPNYTALYSNRWETPFGDFGFLIDGVDSKLITRSDGIAISNYGCRTNLVTETPNGSGGTTTTPITNPNVACPNPNYNAAQPTSSTNPLNVPGVYFPRGAAFTSQTTNRERTGLALAGQWKSNDGTMQATVQFLRSDAKQTWVEHRVEIATDNVTSNGDSWPEYGTNVDINNAGIFTGGTLTSNSTGWRADTFNGAYTPAYGLQSNDILRNHWQDDTTSDLSYNFKWTPNDHWGFKFDGQHIDSLTRMIDNGIWASTYQDASIVTHGDNLPTVKFLPVTDLNYQTGANCSTTWQGCGGFGPGGGSNPANNFWRSAMDHYEHNTGNEDALRADGEYLFIGNDWIKAIDFGVRWSDRKQVTQQSNYNWGVLSESWGGTTNGGGPVWLNDTVLGTGKNSEASASLYTFNNFMKGETPVPTAGNPLPFYNGSTLNVAQYDAFATSIANTWGGGTTDCPQGLTSPIATLDAAATATAGTNIYEVPNHWLPAADRCGVIPGTPYEPYERNPIDEANIAGYIETKFRHDLDNGTKISGNLGLRYTATRRTVDGFLAYPFTQVEDATQCAADAAQAAQNNSPYVPSVWCALTPSGRAAAQAFSNGTYISTTTHFSYNYLLPSFNLKVEPTNKIVLRFSAGQQITPPDMGLTRDYFNYGIDTLSAGSLQLAQNSNTVTVDASAGNPRLKPTESTSYDLSGEWYFAQDGSLTLALFHKDLTNVVSSSTVREPVTNNGVTYSAIVTTPINSPDVGKINGLELSYQQSYTFLPGVLSGLGFNGNFTYITSQGVKQNDLTETDPQVTAGNQSTIDTSKLPLQGLSRDNVNAELFYEKYGISARVAYNWRSDFLLTPRDVIVPFQPIMQAAAGTLDASIFYEIHKGVKIGLQGVNLINTVFETKAVIGSNAQGGLDEAGRSWFMEDRRITAILRATF